MKRPYFFRLSGGTASVALALSFGAALTAACGGSDPAADDGSRPGRGGSASGGTSGAGASAGAGAAPIEPGPAVALPLVVDEVDWNAKQADVGNVQIALETASATLLFGSRGLLVLAGGVIASADDTATDFRDAAAIARTTDTRILAVTGSGDVLEVADGDSLVAARDRLGLAGHEVFWVKDVGGRAVFGLEKGIAVADGGKTGFYDLDPLSSVAASATQVAGLSADGASVRVFDVVAGTLLEYPLPGVTAVAWDENLTPPRLLAAVGKTLYRADATAALVVAFEASAPFSALSSASADSSPRRTWGLVGSELAQIDSAAISVTTGAALSGTRLFGSATGAWVTSPSAPLRRLAMHAASPEEDLWNKTVQPAFAHSCTPCHLPGGTADADLSTYARWVELRAKIHRKVFGEGTVVPSMPPAGYPLSDSDRAAIATFTAADAGAAGAAGSAGSGGGAGAAAAGSANQ
jgi:hypothetical protein